MSAVQTTTPRLSLFQIESELLGLIDQREDALERARAGEDVLDELAVIDGLILDYVKAEIKKVDGIAIHIKEYTARSEAKAKAASELQTSANRDAETAKRIKAMVLQVMQEFDEKKLPGKLFTITRQANGGVAPLVIAQPDLVPDRFQIVSVRMSLDEWKRVRGLLEKKKVVCEAGRPEPNNGAVRAALESADKQETALHLEAAGNGWTEEQLSAALSKVERVPGARIEDRGEHVRIK